MRLRRVYIRPSSSASITSSTNRLRKETAGGAWCPKSQIEKGVREWLQVDLPGAHVVTGVQTQGRYDHGRGQEYVEDYTLEYRRPGFTEWRRYKRWDNKEVRREARVSPLRVEFVRARSEIFGLFSQLCFSVN